MDGQIWLESEGLGKGCTATFIIKLGIYEDPNGYSQQLVPINKPSHGDPDISGPRAPFKDERTLMPPKAVRYQRSV